MEDICGYCLDKEATLKRFFALCDYYGIKNKDLVKLFEVSDVIVSYWRNGSRFPGWDKIMLFSYIIGLPLEVVIIGRKVVEEPQIKNAIKKINSLKEKKYIKNLQSLLDNGELDYPPLIYDSYFNPLTQNTKSLDYTSSEYAKFCADVRYYGLKKNCKLSNDAYYQTIESSSLYMEMNGKKILHIDEYGNLINGTRIDTIAYNNDKKTIILRFRNGLLDGDEYDKNGNYIETKPAVETSGHIEYWRKGFLHRDDGLAAIITKGFTEEEFWENGKRKK